MFAVCELKAYSQVSAIVNETGNTSGELPERLGKPEELRMSIIEGTKDNPYDFIYDSDGNNYSIDKGKFVPQPGISYRWTGLVNKNESDPQIVIPPAVTIESVQANLVSEIVDIKTVELTIKVPLQLAKETFFHIDLKVEGAKLIKPIFEENVSAYKPLAHRSGFLVDYSRINKSIIKLKVEIDTKKPIQEIAIELSNASPSYYYYNKFKSDNLSNVSETYVNPTISGSALNIYNSKTIGCFSAVTATSIIAKVK